MSQIKTSKVDLFSWLFMALFIVWFGLLIFRDFHDVMENRAIESQERYER